MHKDHHKRGTRDTIIDAAERLLDRYGYSKMTMTDLADEAGIGVGTIYLYFPGKAEIVMAVLERLTSTIRLHLQQIASSCGPAADKVCAILMTRLQLRYESARSHHHQTDDLKRAVQSAVEERRAGWVEAETVILITVLEEGRRLGAFDFSDARATAQAMILATNSMTPRYLSPIDFEQPEIFRDKAECIIALLMCGLKSRRRVSSDLAEGNVCEV